MGSHITMRTVSVHIHHSVTPDSFMSNTDTAIKMGTMHKSDSIGSSSYCTD